MVSVLIVNPTATKVTEERLAQVQSRLPKPLETLITGARGHAMELARELGTSVEALYVFSGDGTYNEVLNGVRGSVPVGFIPGGGTSVLPRALGLPRDPVRAAERVAAGRVRRIGLGRVNGRRFGFSAGIGLDAELIRRVDELGRAADGARPGDRAFARETLRLFRERRFRLEPTLELDGIGRAAFAFVANCSPYTYAGGVGLRFAPRASFDAGLDVVGPERLGPASLPRVGWWALGRGGSHVRAHDIERLVIRCDLPTALQVDGEDIGDVSVAELESEREAISVLT